MSGIAVPRQLEPRFLQRLRLHAGDSKVKALNELLFTIVSETLITANLAEIPGAEGVPAAVRSVIRDHAKDEARHHVFYRNVLFDLWSNIDKEQQETAGEMIPRLIMSFMEPDRPAIIQEMELVGIARAQAGEIFAEACSDTKVSECARASASMMIEYVKQLGALEIPRVFDEFSRLRLL